VLAWILNWISFLQVIGQKSQRLLNFAGDPCAFIKKERKSQVCLTQSTGVGKIEDKMEGKTSLKFHVFFQI
jgi:hypothetical protein